jgi:K+-transporting ATPase ATPase B chain
MIAMVEGADRRKTPNEIALAVLLAGLTLIFLIAVVTLLGLGKFSGVTLDPLVLGALFITLIPTTIGGLLSAVGIAGMDRLLKVNVLATSGRAVEAAGDVDTLLLDKTGTITFGNRMAVRGVAAPGVRPDAALRAALIASLADETPEGRSIVELARNAGRHSASPGRRDLDPVQRDDAPVGPRRRRQVLAQGRGGRRLPLAGDLDPKPGPAEIAAASTASPARAARRWPSARTARWSASSTSRTW